ncbi:MAG: hypothetical protein H0X37_05305 [Herpetosiphonaceae bacterium]|nr:hypothetical protein [Herpetosiphonaceae bacterium]
MMYRNKQYGRTTIYIALAVGAIIFGFLVYGLTHAITQASLALVAGTMLLIGNAPELVRTLRQREIGLAMLNTLVAIALLSFFLVHWLGFIFYVPLIGSLLLALPLTMDRVGVARTYLGVAKAVILQLRHFIRLPDWPSTR